MTELPEPNVAHDVLLPHLDRDDFEQMRIDTLRLTAENLLLKKRIAYLEQQIVIHAWGGWQLH